MGKSESSGEMTPINDWLKAKIDSQTEWDSNREPLRTYIGASVAGSSCDRKLWYILHTAWRPHIPAKMQYMFDDGHVGEKLMAKRLRKAGLTLHTRDPKTGEQYKLFEPALEALLEGHPDGFLTGIGGDFSTWYIWEHKQTDLIKTQKTIEKKTDLMVWSEVYYAQAQLYMRWSGLARHITSLATAGGRNFAFLTTPYNREYTDKLVERIRFIHSMPGPPEGVSNTREWFECNDGLCGYADVCFHERFPLKNCRTCQHVALPLIEGKMEPTCKCQGMSVRIPQNYQLTGCGFHRYNPHFFTGSDIKCKDMDSGLLLIDDESNQLVIPDGKAHSFETQLIKHALAPEVQDVKKPSMELGLGSTNSDPSPGAEQSSPAESQKSSVRNAIASYLTGETPMQASEVAQEKKVSGPTKRRGRASRKRTVQESFNDEIPF